MKTTYTISGMHEDDWCISSDVKTGFVFDINCNRKHHFSTRDEAVVWVHARASFAGIGLCFYRIHEHFTPENGEKITGYNLCFNGGGKFTDNFTGKPFLFGTYEQATDHIKCLAKLYNNGITINYYVVPIVDTQLPKPEKVVKGYLVRNIDKDSLGNYYYVHNENHTYPTKPKAENKPFLFSSKDAVEKHIQKRMAYYRQEKSRYKIIRVLNKPSKASTLKMFIDQAQKLGSAKLAEIGMTEVYQQAVNALGEKS